MNVLVVGTVLATLTAAAADRETSRTIKVELPNPLADIQFAIGSADVPPTSDEALRATVTWLRDHPDRLLYVEGHADPQGGAAMNLRLSQLRGEAVRDELIRLGADHVRVVVSAYGEGGSKDEARPQVVLRGSEDSYQELIDAQHPHRRASR